MIPRQLSGAPAFTILATLAVSAAVAGACSNSVPSDQGQGGTTTTTIASSSSGSAGDGGTDGAPGCTMNPTTYLEIINACTNAQQIALNPVLPLLTADGGLPPLP